MNSNLTFLDLYNRLESGKIDLSEFQKEYMRTKELKEIQQEYTKFKQRKDDGRLYITINRKSYYGKTKEEVWEKIREALYVDSTKTLTINDIFPDFMNYENSITKEKKLSPKTLKEYKSMWINHIKDSDLASKPIIKLSPNDFAYFFSEKTYGGKWTCTMFNNVRGLLNRLIRYSIRQNYISVNPLTDIKARDFDIKPVNRDNQDYFTINDRDKLINHILTNHNDDIYGLAIVLNFYLGVRIGELLAIRKELIDFKNRVVHIHEQMQTYYEMDSELNFSPRTYRNVDFLKGRTKHGYRHMPLVDDSISIIMKIYELNSDSQYLFAKNNKRLYKDTFNEHLKKYCEDVGINSKSSHKIRFYYASKLYNDGAKVTNIKRLLGHSKLETTLHYIQSVVDNEEADEEVRNILNKSANRLQTIIQ